MSTLRLPSTRRRLVLVAAACLLAGCTSAGVDESGGSSAGSSSGSSSSVEPTSAVSSSVPVDASTDADTTAVSTTAAATTSPPTTKPDPCAGFTGLDAYGRMQSLRDGQTPTDPACAELVQASYSALATMNASQTLFERYGALADDMVTDFQCGYVSNPLTFRNDLDTAVRTWGIVSLDASADGPIYGFSVFLSAPITPNTEFTVKVPELRGTPQPGSCRYWTRAFVDPSGDHVGDAGLNPMPDDPQAANDPATFYAEIDAAGDRAEAEQSFALQVARVEDVHSPDLFGGTEGFNGLPAPAPATTDPGQAAVDDSLTTWTYCETLLQQGNEGEPGELRIIALDGNNPTWSTPHRIQIALFRRGSDLLWRYNGRAISIDPAAPEQCALPAH